MRSSDSMASKPRAQREKNLSEGQRTARAQRVEGIYDTSLPWDVGTTKNYAAQLRAFARVMAKDPDFGSMRKQAKVWAMITNCVTAETEAFRDRQSAKAKKPRPSRKAPNKGR
jgi:hypothetical protein